MLDQVPYFRPNTRLELGIELGIVHKLFHKSTLLLLMDRKKKIAKKDAFDL
jgi:hypothetical protein